MDAKTFLSRLFGYKPEEMHLCVWTLPDKKSRFFTSVDEAAESAEMLKQTHDVYVGPGIFVNNLGANTRGSKEDVAGLAAFGMDIDIANPLVHKKDDLPQDLASATELLNGIALKPTMLVSTGYGLHVWWVFKEPYVFDNDADKADVEALNRKLQGLVKSIALKRGWKLDSTHDITRVLRVAGTFNLKDKASPKPVQIIYDNGPEYGGPEDFKQFLDDVKIPEPSAVITDGERKIVDGNITINLDASMPEQVETMMGDPKFKATWLARRKDFKKESPSEYVMSLASYGVRWGLSDQEICDMMVVWYRQNLETPQFKFKPNPISIEKLKRKKYLVDTIAKAKHQIDKDKANEAINEMADMSQEEIVSSTDADMARKTIQKVMGLNILEIIKYTRADKDPYYEMHTDKGVITFKTPTDMTTRKRFSDRVFAAIDVPTDSLVNDNQWRVIKTLFKHFMVVRDVDIDETTVQQQLKSMLEGYLENQRPRNITEVTSDNEPFIHNGAWHVNDSKFKAWIWQNRTISGDLSDLKLDMNRSGCERMRYDVPLPKSRRRRTLRCWRIPPSMITAPPVACVSAGMVDGYVDDEETPKSMEA